MNERIRALRLSLGLTLESFGSHIGMSKSGLSQIENGKNGTTDQTIKSICREFHVREEWLRTGEGEMYEDAAPDDVDAFLRTKGVVGLEADLFKAYLTLPEDLRKAFLDYFTRHFEEKAAEQARPDGRKRKGRCRQ